MDPMTLAIVCYVLSSQPQTEYCTPPMSHASALIRAVPLEADPTVSSVSIYQAVTPDYTDRILRITCVTAEEAAFAHKIVAASQAAQNDEELRDPFRGHESTLKKLPSLIRSAAFDTFDICIPRSQLVGYETVDRMMEFMRDKNRRDLLVLIHESGYHWQPVVYVIRRRLGCPLPPFPCTAE